jgi:3,4-dihydroxy 2-butanone 4-phosphate synthase/GTP cyclohydrolase II
VVLDSKLRFPPGARLLREAVAQPVIATTHRAPRAAESALRRAGALVLRLPTLANGFINLNCLFERLADLGVRSVMVEGGGQVITGVLAGGLADQMVVTVSPRLVGGLRAVSGLDDAQRLCLPRLRNVRYQSLADDLIICAELERPREHIVAPRPRRLVRAGG